MTMTWRILVVGAGIAGLGAARALRQRGLAVDVVEQEPQWTQVGAGVYLPGNAARALRGLGLESAVAEHGAVIARQRFCDHRGRLLSEIDVAHLWRDVGPCLARAPDGPARDPRIPWRAGAGPNGPNGAAAQPARRHRSHRVQ